CFYYDETLDEQGRVVYETTKRKIVHDLYIENGHTYLTGQILVENRKHVFDPETGLQTDESSYDSIGSYPFLEVDGVMRNITPKDLRGNNPYHYRGMRFYHDGKKLYTVIGSGIVYYTFSYGIRDYVDYYVAEDGGEPYFIGSFGNWGAYDIGKVGDDWYMVGIASGRPCFQLASEFGGMNYIYPVAGGDGALTDVIDYHGEPLITGTGGIVYYHDSIIKLPVDSEYIGAYPLFAKMIDDDLYIGGLLFLNTTESYCPILWKNGEVKMLLKKIPADFAKLYCTDVEVSGGKLYVATEGLYVPDKTTHAVLFTFDDSDYITTYDEHEDMVTSVEIMKEDPNANTFRSVEYIPYGQFGPRLSSGYQHISQTRIMLKY
ncbi:MAG: hypothetical protein Q4D14_05435, partial [Bacteroidales bacterium]|nr:hypothetical protein [Bacteroidales bacterium]